MGKRNLILGLVILFIALAGLWLKAYRELPTDPDTVFLKDNSQVKGKIVNQEFGKYVVIEKTDNSRQVVVWDQVRDIKLSNLPWYLRVNDALEAIVKFGIIGGFMVFGVGLWQYSDAQKWKRSEFLLKEIRLLEDNPNVVNAQQMLKGENRSIYLYGENEAPVTVDRGMMERAVSASDLNDDEQAIRYAFNIYFSYLDHFNNILDLGLVRKRELKLYVETWLQLIGSPNSATLSSNTQEKLWSYIRSRGFNGTIALMKKFGYVISQQASKPTSHQQKLNSTTDAEK